MNIFVLDKDPHTAAYYHCDKHVVKMILEAGQMLCTAHWTHALLKRKRTLQDFKRVRDAKEWLRDNTPQDEQPPWGLTHARHPCTIWTGENTGNYQWHTLLMRALLDEYTRRYGRRHKSEATYDWVSTHVPQGMIRALQTPHPQCMPDDCKVKGNPVAAYRNYYNNYKRHMAKWKTGNVPIWWENRPEYSSLSSVGSGQVTTAAPP